MRLTMPMWSRKLHSDWLLYGCYTVSDYYGKPCMQGPSMVCHTQHAPDNAHDTVAAID